METPKTIHEKINFKSHWPPNTFHRSKRVKYFGHLAKEDNYMSFSIPYWQELQQVKEDRFMTFLNKF